MMMHINFGWINEILSSAGGHLVGETIKKLVVDTWAPKVGETLGEYSADWIAFRVAGPRVTDERKYKDALERLDPNEKGILEHRLAQLASHEQDRYRVIIMRDDINQMVRIMRDDAQRPDNEWEEHVRIMNLGEQEDEGRFQRFTTWCETHMGELWDDLVNLNSEIGHAAARIAAGNDMIREELERRRDETPFERVTRSFRRAMAPPWEREGRGRRHGGRFEIQAEACPEAGRPHRHRPNGPDDDMAPEGRGGSRRSRLGLQFFFRLPYFRASVEVDPVFNVDGSAYRQRQQPNNPSAENTNRRGDNPTAPAGTRNITR